MKIKLLSALAFLAAGFAVPALAAETYEFTDAVIEYTDNAKYDPIYGTGTDDQKLTTLRLEHFGVNGVGDNYINAEVYFGKNVGNIPSFAAGAGSFGDNNQSNQFLVYNPRLSASKITGSDWSAGFIKDFYLAGRLEVESYANFRSPSIGLSVDLKVPGASFFEQDLYFRRSFYTGNTTTGGTLYSRTVFVFPVTAGPINAKIYGLLLINKRRDAYGTEEFFQPDLMFPIGHTGIELGYRHEIHRYDGYFRQSPTFMAKWFF
jgi:nucleoside-specific outer membrane channel protein Tsx